jgi:hypothetical protein
MLKNITQFRSVINGIETFFHFDQNCPLDVAKSALFECLKWIGQVEDNAKAQLEAQVAAATAPVEETKVEPIEAPKVE